MRFNLYGLAIAAGILAAVLYMRREAPRISLPRDIALDVALWAVPLAVVFSRLYYVAFTWDRYKGDLLSILRVWEGGLAIYGGVIGGALGVLALAKARKIPFPQLADLVAPGLLLAQAIGRWGNFFNSEAYGTLVLNPDLQFFPVAVYADGGWHLAAFFYESVWNLTGFAFLLRFRKTCYKAGWGYVFAAYLIWYGLGRMVIEGIRTDSLMWGSLRVSQVLSAAAIAIAGIIVQMKRRMTPMLHVPLCMAILCFAAFAIGRAWALLPAYILMTVYGVGLAVAFKVTAA